MTYSQDNRAHFSVSSLVSGFTSDCLSLTQKETDRRAERGSGWYGCSNTVNVTTRVNNFLAAFAAQSGHLAVKDNSERQVLLFYVFPSVFCREWRESFQLLTFII